MIELIVPILKGAAIGTVTGLVGYFKSNPSLDLKGFDYKKVLPVVFTSAAAGGWAIYSGITYSASMDLLVASGLGLILERAVKTVVRLFTKE